MLSLPVKKLLDNWIFVLVRCGETFLVPYTEEAWEKLLKEGDYGATFPAFLHQFMEALQQGSWASGSYYPGGWFRTLAAQGADPMTVEINQHSIASFFLEEVLVMDNGDWVMGEHPIKGRIASLFLQNLHFDAQLERYFVRYAVDGKFDIRYLRHLAPPLRVRRVHPHGNGLRLNLNSGEEELLRSDTLYLDAQEHLYCAVRGQNLPARFEDAARWELLKDAEETPTGWRIPLDGETLTLQTGQPWPFADPVLPQPLQRPQHRPQ